MKVPYFVPWLNKSDRKSIDKVFKQRWLTNGVPISDAFVNSDAILLVTDHDIFSTLNLDKIKQEMNTPIVIDGRNFFNTGKMTSLGFSYRAIGKP